jgi:hypothetical protein
VAGPLSLPPSDWRAARDGEQAIHVDFATPVAIARVRLVFRERELQRTQQFTLSWIDGSGGRREAVRQQFTFSPQGATEEVEEYTLNASSVARLEVRIVPDISGGAALAQLSEFRLA